MEGSPLCEGTPEERTCLIDPEIYVLDSVSVSLATGHPHCCCQASPAMHQYSPASHCDKSYYTGEKEPSYCAKPPTVANNPDLFPWPQTLLELIVLLTKHLPYNSMWVWIQLNNKETMPGFVGCQTLFNKKLFTGPLHITIWKDITGLILSFWYFQAQL